MGEKMKSSLMLVLVIAAFGFHGVTSGAVDGSSERLITVVDKDGRVPTIVLPVQADKLLVAAAQDLQHYLVQMTNLKITLVTGKELAGFAICLGDLPGNQDLKSAIEANQLGAEGFVLDISDTGIRILGGSPLGTSHGVYELLERMGVRWLFAGEWGEVVPRTITVKLPAGRFADKPAFSVREMDSWSMGAPSQFSDWARRLRHNFPGFGGHSGLICEPKYRQSHPEWFALVDGKRQNEAAEPKLCHSNPEMVAQASKNTLAWIRELKKTQPDFWIRAGQLRMISISPTDGGGFCRCEKCLAMGSPSDRLQIFANTISQAVRKEFPDYHVGYYGAYSEAQDSPTVSADPGVVVFMTTWNKDIFRTLQDPRNKAFRKKVEGFFPKCPILAVRDFDGMTCWWGYSPVSLINVHAVDYPWYLKHGVRGILTEAVDEWAAAGQSYYVMSKLWWNPNADVEAIKRDFVEKGFGASFKPMGRYYERINREKVYLQDATLLAMRHDLEEAAKLADRPDVKRRIDCLRLYHLMLDTYQQASSGKLNEKELLTAARIGHTLVGKNIVFKGFCDLVDNFYTQAAKTKPQQIHPFTSEQLDKVLSCIVLPPTRPQISRWNSADDYRLVPLSTAKEPFKTDMAVAFRYGPNTILIYAQPGEPIEITTPCVGETTYELRGPEQAVISEGMLSLAKPLRLTATTKGIYTLTIDTHGHVVPLSISNRWAVIKAASVEQHLQIIGGIYNTFFHVPKGTKEFAVVAKGDVGEPCIMTVWGPHDAKKPLLPRTVFASVSYEEHRIKVPAGADGKVWKLALDGEDKDVFLVGIPPFLASDPARLLKAGN
jgi:hypothetical protein